jgi:TRAP-type C4-dicarboxylate transport system substrate-binding protein
VQKLIISALAGVAAIAALSTGAHADTVRATSGFGPSHFFAKDVYPALFKELEVLTDGRWTGQDTPSGLVSASEMNTALRDGVSELGAVILPYFAAEYPESLLPAELSIVGTDHRAISSAATEYIVSCPECLAEFSRNGQVYLGSDTTAIYQFLSRVPMRSVADVKGVRIRTGGPVFARFVEQIGGVPVQMPISEIFESMSQGTLDATFSSTPDLKNFRLNEVAKYVVDVDFGVFNAGAIMNASKTLWDRMTPEDRGALVRASQDALALSLELWGSQDGAAREESAAAGVEFIPADTTIEAAKADFTKAHLAAAAGILTERGVTDAEAKVQRYLALVDKWQGLIGPDTTTEQLGDMRYEQIWSKVDFSSYGS